MTNIVAAVCSDIGAAATAGFEAAVVLRFLAKRIDPARLCLLPSELNVRFFDGALSTLWMSLR